MAAAYFHDGSPEISSGFFFFGVVKSADKVRMLPLSARERFGVARPKSLVALSVTFFSPLVLVRCSRSCFGSVTLADLPSKKARLFDRKRVGHDVADDICVRF